MARIVLTNMSVTVGAVDLSDHITSVTIESAVEAVDTTSMSSSAVKTQIGGLKTNTVTLDFHQDFAASSVEATLYPLIGTNTIVLIKPINTTVSVSNPSYSLADVLVTSWTPVNGGVGELSTASVTYPCGAITKATTP
jgi:hypothetical protein